MLQLYEIQNILTHKYLRNMLPLHAPSLSNKKSIFINNTGLQSRGVVMNQRSEQLFLKYLDFSFRWTFHHRNIKEKSRQNKTRNISVKVITNKFNTQSL